MRGNYERERCSTDRVADRVRLAQSSTCESSPSASFGSAIVNDTSWSTLVGTWRPGRLELYVDGFSRVVAVRGAFLISDCCMPTSPRAVRTGC
jgi:hypothetical protein